MERHVLDCGTVLSVHPPAAAPATSPALAVLFDGRPMIEEGIPDALRALQAGGRIGPLTTVYVESIAGSTKRGPTRVASLTDPEILGRFLEVLVPFLERHVDVPDDPGRSLALGHSLGGNAALHAVCRWPDLFGAAATGSAALWWPGDDVQLSGRQVTAEVLAASGSRIWMTVGRADDASLVAANREFWAEAERAGLDLVHDEHDGGHELAGWRAGLTRALPHLLGPGSVN